jgi:hypothetical protein
MFKNYTILCLLALVALIHSMPTNNIDLTDEEEDSNDNSTTKEYSRELHDKIDGAIHHIKAAGVTYRQRITDNRCFVEYDGRLLGENSVIKIRKKTFRVEDCLLERVYHACGPNLLLMLGLVCRVVEQQKSLIASTNFKREATIPSIHYLDPTANRIKRVITESCCENHCSISELTRYCHE